MKGPEARKHFQDSDDLCRYMVEQYGDTAILSFSRGKDSIGCWILMKRHFKRIIPYYLSLLPELLEIEKESLEYFEDVMGTEIIVLPNPNPWTALKWLVCQPPERCASIEEAKLFEFTTEDVTRAVQNSHGIPKAYCAVGVRMTDSPQRRMTIQKHGPINHTKMTFQAIFDWKNDRLEKEIREAGIKLPVDYRIWGRSLDGFDYRFLEPMRRLLPRDYETVLRWFPLADAFIARVAFWQRDQSLAKVGLEATMDRIAKGELDGAAAEGA